MKNIIHRRSHGKVQTYKKSARKISKAYFAKSVGHTKLENLHSPYYASFTFSKANKALHLVEHCHLSRLLGMLFYKPRDFIGVLGLNKPLVWRAAVVLSMSMKNRRASEKQLARAEVRRKPKNRHRNRGFAAEEIDNLSDALFKEMFRINREAFEYIETLLDARIVRDAQKAKNSSGSVISSWESIYPAAPFSILRLTVSLSISCLRHTIPNRNTRHPNCDPMIEPTAKEGLCVVKTGEFDQSSVLW